MAALTFPSLSASGRLSNSTAGSHRGRGRAAGLWHHQEAFDPVGSHGGHRVHTLFVSLPSHMDILSSLVWWLSLGGDYVTGLERFQYLKVELRNYTQQHKHHSNNCCCCQTDYCLNICLIAPQVQFCVWSGGGFGLQPRGRSPDTHDEPERRSSLPGNTGLYTAGQ